MNLEIVDTRYPFDVSTLRKRYPNPKLLALSPRS
jgi:hypothetical protein